MNYRTNHTYSVPFWTDCQKRINPRPPCLGYQPVDPRKLSSNICAPKQTCYPITNLYPDYGSFNYNCGCPLPKAP